MTLANQSLAMAIIGLLLGPALYRLSITIPSWVLRSCDDPVEVKVWSQWEVLIAVELALMMALVPLCVRGHGIMGVAVTVYVWVLLLLALIDTRTMLLPDVLTIPLLLAGLLLSASGIGIPVQDSVIGAVFGGGFLWVLNAIHRLISGVDGMGQGDMKLLAAIGAWQGYQALPNLLLIASLIGAAWGIARRGKRNEHFSFGPMLCIAAFMSMHYAHQI